MAKNILFIFIGLLIFTGCSKSSSTTNTPTISIVGKWTISADSVTEYVNGVRTMDSVDQVVPGSYRQFNTDGTCIDYGAAANGEPASTANLTYTSSADSVKFHYPSYTYNGTTYPAHTDSYKILSLTSTRLGLKYTEGPDGGTQSSFNEYYWYTK